MSSAFSLTPLQLRILRFFQEQPHAIETGRGIATWLGDEQRSIEKALEGLVGRKWLAMHETAAVTGYALTRDERFLTQIREVLEDPSCGAS